MVKIYGTSQHTQSHHKLHAGRDTDYLAYM